MIAHTNALGMFIFHTFCPTHFGGQAKGNHLLESLWLYLVGLSKCPNTLQYVGMNPHMGNIDSQVKTPIGI
jgi:hypothetical protein